MWRRARGASDHRRRRAVPRLTLDRSLTDPWVCGHGWQCVLCIYVYRSQHRGHDPCHGGSIATAARQHGVAAGSARVAATPRSSGGHRCELWSALNRPIPHTFLRCMSWTGGRRLARVNLVGPLFLPNQTLGLPAWRTAGDQLLGNRLTRRGLVTARVGLPCEVSGRFVVSLSSCLISIGPFGKDGSLPAPAMA